MLMFSLVRFVSSIFYENEEIMYWEIGFTCYSIFLVTMTFKGSPEKVKFIFSLTNNLLCVL